MRRRISAVYQDKDGKDDRSAGLKSKLDKAFSTVQYPWMLQSSPADRL